MEQYKAWFLTGPHQIALDTIPIPKVGPNEVLVQIHQTNLCPTDIKKYTHLDENSARILQKRGVILGHECAGLVVEVGKEVSKHIKPGMPVAIDPMLPCKKCAYCNAGDFPLCANLRGIGASAGSIQDAVNLLSEGIGGAFAEYTKVPAENIFPLPESLELEAGALMEPLADVVHSIDAAKPTPSETAVVFGLGAMGLMHVRLLSFIGLQKIIGVDPIPQRRLKAELLGSSDTIDPSAADPIDVINSLTRGYGADVIFVCAGGEAQKLCTHQSLKSIRKKGRIMLYASATKPAEIPIDINKIHYGMLILSGTVGFYKQHAEKALDFLTDGIIDVNTIREPVIPFENLDKAFEISSQPEVVKVGIKIKDE